MAHHAHYVVKGCEDVAKALVPVDSIAKCADEFVQIQQIRKAYFMDAAATVAMLREGGGHELQLKCTSDELADIGSELEAAQATLRAITAKRAVYERELREAVGRKRQDIAQAREDVAEQVQHARRQVDEAFLAQLGTSSSSSSMSASVSGVESSEGPR